MGSFDEKLKVAPVLEIEAGVTTVIKVMWKGLCIKEEVIVVDAVEYNPSKKEGKVQYTDLSFLKSIE